MWIISTLLLIITSITVEVELSDGLKRSGELKTLSSSELSIANVDGARTFTRSEISSAKFAEPVDGVESPTAYVRIADGSLATVRSITMDDGTVRAEFGDGHVLETADSTVRAVRWITPGQKTDDVWNEILSKSASDDLLVIRRSESLDYLKGVVLGVTNAAVQFDYEGNTIPVPLARVAGFILARQNKEFPAARLRLSTHDGGQWLLKSAELKDDTLKVVSMAGVSAILPVTSVSRIDFPQLHAVFLSKLSPESSKYTPFVGSQLQSTLEKFYAPQLDRGMADDFLRIVDPASASGWRYFRHGLAVQSKTEIVYRLAGKYQRFQALAGIDPTSPSQAELVLKVFGDDKELYQRTFSKADPPVEVDVDLMGTRRMRIVVDYGAGGSIGDRIHLGDARLVK